MANSGTPGLPQVPRPRTSPDAAASGAAPSRAPAPTPGTAGPPADAAPARLAFGDRAGLLRLVVKNTLLTLVTLGVYRFWARTAVRRFYWGNIALAGERFEYTGTGAELFVGFLVAVLLLTPLLGGFAVMQLLTDPESIWSPVESAVYAFVVYVFIAAALFRARRYRLSRTRWRGIRFVQDGSTWRYVGLTLAWSALTALTLGVGFPWLRWAQQRYMMRCTSFGDRRFAFEGGPRPLVVPWLVALALAGIPLAVAGFSGFETMRLMAEVAGDAASRGQDGGKLALDPEQQATMNRLGFRIMASVLAAFAFGGMAFVAYRVAELRTFAAATRLGPVATRSAARAWPVIGRLLWAGALLVLWMLAAGLASGAVAYAAASFMGSGRDAALTIIMALAFLPLAFLGFSVIVELIVRFGILRHVVTTLELSNLATLADIAQSAVAAPRAGEGLADAFDLGPL